MDSSVAQLWSLLPDPLLSLVKTTSSSQILFSTILIVVSTPLKLQSKFKLPYNVKQPFNPIIMHETHRNLNEFIKAKAQPCLSSMGQ
ncbi:hypothetical protein ACE6H2_006454 [Prunus campanulata]